MKRQYVIDALILAALVAFSIFLYHSGKGYTLIFDNRNITLGEKSYKAPEYVQVTLDGKGRPLEIMGGDRDIMTVMGKKHVLKVDILSDDEETVMATIERPFTVRYDGGNILRVFRRSGGCSRSAVFSVSAVLDRAIFAGDDA